MDEEFKKRLISQVAKLEEEIKETKARHRSMTNRLDKLRYERIEIKKLISGVNKGRPFRKNPEEEQKEEPNEQIPINTNSQPN